MITLIISTTRDILIPEKINKKFNFKIGAAFGRIRQHQIAKARKAVSATYTGGCQCGQIRYEIRAEPLTLYLCHCQECQKQSSSAFGMSLTVPRDAVVIIQGQPKAWTRKADSGREVTCLFCGDCGTRLFHERTYSQETINVKAGTLDDTSWLRPVGNLWTRSAQPWVTISEEMLNYEGQPKDVRPLWEKWAEQHS